MLIHERGRDMEPRVYVVLGLWEGADFVPLHRTCDHELIALTARRILQELGAPTEGEARDRLRRSEAKRLAGLFAHYGIPVGGDARVEV